MGIVTAEGLLRLRLKLTEPFDSNAFVGSISGTAKHERWRGALRRPRATWARIIGPALPVDKAKAPNCRALVQHAQRPFGDCPSMASNAGPGITVQMVIRVPF